MRFLALIILSKIHELPAYRDQLSKGPLLQTPVEKNCLSGNMKAFRHYKMSV